MTGATRADPVSLTEALERLLPHHDNPDEVACWLDDQQRRGRIPLLGGGVVMAASANPIMLGVKAHYIHGKRVLYVQIRQGLKGNYPMWDCATMTSLDRHHQFWVFERAGFEKHFPGAPKDRGAPKQGRPGSASAWIDAVAPGKTWSMHTGKGLHDLAEHEVERINTERRQKAKEQNRKPPPLLRCPSVRAFQAEVAARKKRS